MKGPRAATLRFAATVFVPLALLYLATATWSPPYDADTVTNALAAQELGREGDVFLERHVQLADPDFQGVYSWVVRTPDSAASQYPPGAAVLAAPLYAVWPGDGIIREDARTGRAVAYQVPEIAPAAITASLVVALGVTLMALALRELGSDRDALLGAYALGLATGVWSVAADKLWLHTADVLYLSGGFWLSARHQLAAGLSFALAALTRPHTLLVALGTGVGRALDRRSWRVLFSIGFGSALGLVALLAYNAYVFGSPSIEGGYDIETASYVADGGFRFVNNVWGAFFDLSRGLLPFSPFLIVLLPGIPAGWRVAPQWVRGAAVGGLAYMLVQLAWNRFSGGSGFWGYRYPIEMIVAATPVLLLAYREWVRDHPVATRALTVTLAVSVGLHAAGAVRCAQYLC